MVPQSCESMPLCFTRPICYSQDSFEEFPPTILSDKQTHEEYCFSMTFEKIFNQFCVKQGHWMFPCYYIKKATSQNTLHNFSDKINAVFMSKE